MSYAYLMGLGADRQEGTEEPTEDLVQRGREIVEAVQAEFAQDPPAPVIAEPIYVAGEAPAVTNGNGAPATTNTSPRIAEFSGRFTFHWGGLVMLGITGVFFWWVFKRFIPGMHAAALRQQAREAKDT